MVRGPIAGPAHGDQLIERHEVRRVLLPVAGPPHALGLTPGSALIHALAEVIRDAMEADPLNTIGSEFADDRPTLPVPNLTPTPDGERDDPTAA